MTFDELFENFSESAFRLETLQFYNVPSDNERIEDWRQGQPIPIDASKENWLRVIRQARAAGKRMHRVHVVDVPLTEYVRFELEAYAPNVEAGEEILIADRAADRGLEPLRHDFWLFDAETPKAVVALMSYDDEGRFVDFELSTDADALDRCRRERDVALAHAVPLAKFQEGPARA